MPKVTYTDIDGSAPTVTWMRRTWNDGEAQDIEDSPDNAMLLDLAEANSHFSVTGRGDVNQDPPEKLDEPEEVDPRQPTGTGGFVIPPEEAGDTDPDDAYGQGAHAASTGKTKAVPSKFKGTPKAKQWTNGYEDWTKAHAEENPPRVPSPGDAGEEA